MKTKFSFYRLCYWFKGEVKAAVSKLFTNEPRFTQPNLPPLFFEPGSSEYFSAKSEKILLFLFFLSNHLKIK